MGLGEQLYQRGPNKIFLVLVGIWRLGSFAWEFSPAIFHLESFVCDLSLGCFSWTLSFEVSRFETLAWELSLWIFSLGTFAWDLLFGIFSL